MKSIIALALILGAFTVHALDAKAVSNNSQEISAKAKNDTSLMFRLWFLSVCQSMSFQEWVHPWVREPGPCRRGGRS